MLLGTGLQVATKWDPCGRPFAGVPKTGTILHFRYFPIVYSRAPHGVACHQGRIWLGLGPCWEFIVVFVTCLMGT